MYSFFIVLVWTIGENAYKSMRFNSNENGLVWTGLKWIHLRGFQVIFVEQLMLVLFQLVITVMINNIGDN